MLMDDILKELVKTVVLIPNSNKRIGVILHDFNAAKNMARDFYDMMEKVPEYLLPSYSIKRKTSSAFSWDSNTITFFSSSDQIRGHRFDALYISEMSKVLNPDQFHYINFIVALRKGHMVCFE
jgi:phage terminase large subunit-like protein